jgi:hypothetical protein
MAEIERFVKEHQTRKSFDFGWFLAMWDRSFPDDAFKIACLQGQAGFVHNKETQ